MADVMIAEASISENNSTEGAPGDQTGKEVHVRKWYSYPWNCVLRPPSAEVGLKIAQLAEKGAKNSHVGYAWKSRTTYWEQLKKANYDPSKVKTDCNTDCSAFTCATIAAAGYLLKNDKLKGLTQLTTHYMRKQLQDIGFKLLTGSEYTGSADKLVKGDVLLNDVNHVAMCLGTGVSASDDDYSGGSTSNDIDDGITVEDFAIDEYFSTSQQSANPTKDDYFKNLNSDALKIKDIRGILGIPHQFLPTTDVRLDYTVSNSNFDTDCKLGRVYSDKIVTRMPLLLITPGMPSFMSAFSKENKASVLKTLFKSEENDITNVLSEGSSGRYYTLKFAYVEYTKYLNAMLRSAAYFLGIENETIDGRKLGNFNWLYYTTETNTTGEDGTIFTETGIESNLGTSKFLGPYAGCLAMYADCGTSVDDSFSNSTTQSQLSSKSYKSFI